MPKKNMESGLKAFLRKKRELDAKAEKGPFGYHEEYALLRARTLKYRDDKVYETTEGEKPHNFRKNRYKDILPYEHTRVKLKMVNEMPGTDYINANFLQGPQERMTFIAAQGPLPNTVRDFWRLIWEYDTRVILMACSEYEGDPPKHKCERYWPETEEEELRFDQISVRLEKELPSEFDDYKIRYLRAECNNQVHKIYHLHYVGWPDHGVPTSVTPILDMVMKARAYQPDESPPYIVHCSAGCGRTGTIVALEITWNMLKNAKLTPEFEMFALIDELRKQRPSLVQSLEQYRFVYEAVAEIFERHLDTMNKHGYENVSLIAKGSTNFSKEARKSTTGDSDNSVTKAPGQNEDPPKPPKPVTSSNPPIPALRSGSKTLPSPRKLSHDQPKPSAPPKPTRLASSSSQPPSPVVANLRATFEAGSVNSLPSKEARHSETYQSREKLPLARTFSLESDKSIGSVKSTSSRDSGVNVQRPKTPPPDYDAYSLATGDEPMLTLSGVCMEESLEEIDDEVAVPKDNGIQDMDPYAYANPYQEDKWSLQHIALGKSAIGEEAGAYSEVDLDSLKRDRPSQMRKQQQARQYEDVDAPRPMLQPPPMKPTVSTGFDQYACADEVPPDDGSDFDSMSDEEAPEVPVKIGELTRDIIAPVPLVPSAVAPVMNKGRTISFPHKLGKPRGPRQQKNVTATN